MLVEIGSVNNVPAYIKSVKAGEKLLMGFGHRVYKNYDPRAQHREAHRLRSIRRDGAQPADRNCAGMRADRAGRRVLREAQALSERGLLYRTDLSIHGIPRQRCFRFSLPFRARRAGSRNGKKCCWTRNKRFRDLARCIWATICGVTFPSITASSALGRVSALRLGSSTDGSPADSTVEK